MTDHLDVKVDCQPTEMGIRITIHNQSFNIVLEFDPQTDPVYLQSMLMCAPQFIEFALEKITAPDSPMSAKEWWADGMRRLGDIRAERVE